MDTYDVFLHLPGPNRFLVILAFLLVITWLTYRNMRDRAKAEELLRQKLEEMKEAIQSKDRRIREIHHRVKNDLQQISSMIELQAIECQDPDAAERMKQCQSRVHSIAMIHELLNDSVDGEELDVKPYLERLVDRNEQFLNGQAEGVDVNTQIDGFALDAETATSCGLIVSELITNCFKHAFEETQDGRVDVRCERSNGHVELSVEDNGTGFARSNPAPSSLGHDIVHSLVESDLNGDLAYRDTDDGVNVHITFPASDHAARRN